MKWALVAATLLVAVSAVSASKELLRVSEALDSEAEALGRPKHNCDKGFIEVASDKCCPKSHPTLIQGDCYAACGEGFDDLTVGGYVGCRSHCDGGFATSINACHNGPHQFWREDKVRESKPPAVQLPKPRGRARTRCRKGFVKVAYVRTGRRKWIGGCCPKDSPVLIAGKCYPKCGADQDDIVIGDFVGCRAHCPKGFAKEDHNECSKDEEHTEREDFPRFGTEPERRRKKKFKTDADADGCDDDWTAVSESRCCPANRPVLIGMLCYARCSYGYERSGFGCRRACPKGYRTHPLTCTHKRNGKTISRKGKERAPRASKQRVAKDSDSAQSVAQIAASSAGTA